MVQIVACAASLIKEFPQLSTSFPYSLHSALLSSCRRILRTSARRSFYIYSLARKSLEELVDNFGIFFFRDKADDFEDVGPKGRVDHLHPRIIRRHDLLRILVIVLGGFQHEIVEDYRQLIVLPTNRLIGIFVSRNSLVGICSVISPVTISIIQ